MIGHGLGILPIGQELPIGYITYGHYQWIPSRLSPKNKSLKHHSNKKKQTKSPFLFEFKILFQFFFVLVVFFNTFVTINIHVTNMVNLRGE